MIFVLDVIRICTIVNVVEGFVGETSPDKRSLADNDPAKRIQGKKGAASCH
jgi:hypothetical protein